MSKSVNILWFDLSLVGCKVGFYFYFFALSKVKAFSSLVFLS